MSQTREKRRVAGALRKGLEQAGLERVEDPRDQRGRRWKLTTLLKAVLVGIVAGCTNLKGVETLTERISTPMRNWLGLCSRVPDTTLRDVLCQLTPEVLRAPLHRVVKAAQRRKALAPQGMPFGVASLDGKSFTIAGCDDWYAQRHTQSENSSLAGLVRTVTVALTSIAARPIIDVVTIPAHTNEMGQFEAALRGLMQVYRGTDLFRLITYDAGACSLHNATVTRELGLHYLFALKESQPGLLEETRRVLGARLRDTADAVSKEHVGSKICTRRVFLAEASLIAAPDGWLHLRTLVRVEFESRNEQTGETTFEGRYFASSLPKSRLTAAQWLLVVRRHWGVELAHQTLDVALLEDPKPWITANPRGAAVVAVLRRIAYTMLTLFRSVTQRSEQRRNTPWKELLGHISFTLLTFSVSDRAGLRRHRLPAPS